MIRCSEGCVHDDCLSTSGTCTCKDGYWDERCDKKCSVRCVKCDRNSGECTQCIEGFFGSKCEDCSYCRSSCDTGGCVDGCLTGYYGRFCHVPCNRHCRLTDQNRCFIQRNSFDEYMSENCTSQCDQERGNCRHGCDVGYFGLSCGLQCNENCLASSCGHLGQCLHGCKVGYFGTLCELKCSSFCKNRHCHRVNGDCFDGCEPGVFGSHCNTNCTNCVNNQCHQGTGECNECEAGYYGWRCNKKCRMQCTGRPCHRYEGTCLFQTPSHETTTSSQDEITTKIPLTTTPHQDQVPLMVVVIPSVSFVTVVTVMTVFIFICKRISIKELHQSPLSRRPQYPIPLPPDATHQYEVISEYDTICPSQPGLCRPVEYEEINATIHGKALDDEISSTNRYPCQNTDKADVNKSLSSTEMFHTTESLSLPNLSNKFGYIPMTSTKTYLTIASDRRNSSP
ncbi:scavenger receptor class F member 2-like [Haliotis rufescens]|uniref:scavenger receptor class F member 2-like n=1 Tax=Haliotis rufescens TaxID=6454 RepID=UPI00201F7C58|nr:scavenger receptor class F member 2-like [Haliotis rufescens]